MPRLKDHSLAKKAPEVKKKPKSKPIGQAKAPTRYSEALGDEICALLEKGESLNEICKSDRFPSETAVRKWSLDADHPFSSKYARAREIGYWRLADEIIKISDDGTNDYIERAKEEGASIVVDHDHIARSRLRIETRKWILSKMLPKTYGDKLQLQGDKDQPLHLTLDTLLVDLNSESRRIPTDKGPTG